MAPLVTNGSRSVTVLQRLRTAIRAANRAGFRVRTEWLGGESAGWCEYGGKRWIFVDLSLPVTDQIAQIEEALKEIQPTETVNQVKKVA